jgi:ATP-binding cassette subfamily F protein 3
MLQVSNISKQYADRILFADATLTINSGERIALFGRNGSGKSTLLKILCGDEVVDKGDVIAPKGYRIGFLRQHLEFSKPTVIEEVCSALQGDPDLERYKAEIVLDGLGFSLDDLEVSPQELSGGFQIRINLAKLIVSEPNLLLLDEPTNYLDIVSLRWLEGFLQTWEGEIIVISHDRYFCDQVSTHSALVYRGGIRKIEGNSAKLFERIALDEEMHERTRENREREIKRMEQFINRFKAKASKATLVQSRVKALNKIERLDELTSDPTLDFSFSHAHFPGRFPIEARAVSFSYDASGTPLIDKLTFSLNKEDRIGVIGKNGRGKSTLLRLLAGELSAMDGELVLSPNTVLSYFAQTNANRLDLSCTIEQEVQQSNPSLSRTAVRAICGCMMFEGDDALKPIKVLSGGERSRVSLGKILASPSNVLLLDEPTNHLDVESVLALTDALEEFAGAVVIVTHSEEMLRRIANRLIVFQGDIPFLFEGGYDEFLESIGWIEEQGEAGVVKKKKKKAGTSKKEARRQRAQAKQAQDSAINPLRNRAARLEEEVAMLEEEIVELENKLLVVSQSEHPEDLGSLSKSIATKRRSLEETLGRWEETQQELDNLSKSKT